MTVGATGMRQGQVSELGDNEPRKTLTYQAKNVHDFAWVASERYERTELVADDGVSVQALTLDEGSDMARQTRDALAYFAEHFGPYAYETLVAADVTAGGGMEYPGIIMIGFGSIREIAHEVGHQWWYGAVGNDEYDEAWLDEAFTVYSDERYRIEQQGLSERSTRSAYRFNEPGTPVLTPASAFPTLDRYFQSVYTKGSGIVWMLEGWLGRETLDEVLRTYYDRYRFQNVTTADFVATIEDVTGRDMDAFFDHWLRTTEPLDVFVDNVRTLRSSSHEHRYAITVGRQGRSLAPVTVRIVDEAGQRTERQWTSSGDRSTFEVALEAPLAEVIVDPARKLLETDRSDNTWVATRQSARFPLWISAVAIAVMLPLARWGWTQWRPR
jgi:aminopeptidase N